MSFARMGIYHIFIFGGYNVPVKSDYFILNNLPGIMCEPYVTTIDKTKLLSLVNEVRLKGCKCGEKYYPPVKMVKWNDTLARAAQNHANDMYYKRFFSHRGSNGSTLGSRLKAVGYNYTSAGENIAEDVSEASVIDTWLNSPGHCRNIMCYDYAEMGVARAGIYWVQDFGLKMEYIPEIPSNVPKVKKQNEKGAKKKLMPKITRNKKTAIFHNIGHLKHLLKKVRQARYYSSLKVIIEFKLQKTNSNV